MSEVRAYVAFTGRRADGREVRGLIPQFDGSAQAGGNCAAASEAGRAIRSQRGRRPDKGSPWPPTGRSIRAAADDRDGGLTPLQTTGVTQRVYGIVRDIRITTWLTIVAWLRKGGSATLLHSYGPVANAGLGSSPGFYGNHSAEIVGIRGIGTQIEVLFADPLADGRRWTIHEGTRWVPLKVLRAAAAALQLTVTPPVTMARAHPGEAYVVFSARAFTPPTSVTTFHLYRGATKLARPRRYTPRFRNSLMRKTPARTRSNWIGPVQPGFQFQAYQYIVNAAGKWVGNKTGTSWMLFSGVRFQSYI